MRQLSFINHAALHEKAKKSWDYFVSDELVYIVEMYFPDFGWKGIDIETYLDFQFYLVATFKGLGDNYCCTIIEFSLATQPLAAPVVEHRLGKLWNSMPVFIDPIEFMEKPQHVRFRPVRSVVRLKAFDDRMGRVNDIVDFSWGTKFVFPPIMKMGNSVAVLGVSVFKRASCHAK